MIVHETINSIKKELSHLRTKNKTIGFVPTMGALHQGHLSLIQESKEKSDSTVVSIFVNPLQFNDPSDFEKYPRELKRDLDILEEIGVDYIFAPSSHEMYDNFEKRQFDLAHLDQILEGKYRPGHFNGVANVVYRLFDVVRPDFAFFGKKDYQQIFVIKKMVELTNLKVKIIECPIIREKNGLAMSSRNELLSHKERQEASFIYTTLNTVKDSMKLKSIEEWKKFVTDEFKKHSFLQLEYFEFVDPKDFYIVHKLSGQSAIIACMAAYAGKVRLIDNININL